MPTLNWIGKDAVVNHHREVPYRLLRDVPELGCGDPGSGNLLVEGDNLHALKALLPYYAGQVKCIFIDPPYNTGNEGWVYNDAVNSPLIQKWLGETVGKEAEDLSRHDKWLCMMYPRLQLLKQFLREDGLIFVAIGTDELGHLCLLLDETFGRDNRIAIAAWETSYTANQTAKHISETTDYILIYGRNFNSATVGKVGRTEDQLAKFKNLDGDKRGPWKPENLSAGKFYAAGQFQITGPTGKQFTPPTGRYWRCNEAQFNAWLADGRITFGKDGNGRPMLKKFREEITRGLTPSTWWNHAEFGTAKEASLDLKNIFQGEAAFPTPKPVKLVERILQIASSAGDLILDSFMGSGATAHAVLKLNADQPDQPPRRFIGIEMEPAIAKDVTAERIRRVATGYTNAKGEAVSGLGGGFRYCRLDAPLFSAVGVINPDVRFAQLARHVYFTETGEPLPRERVPNTPLVGVYNGTGVYLLFNGILGDKSRDGGNVLTRAILARLPPHSGPKVIYAYGCLLGEDRLRAEQITFRQTPYEITTS
ncbi:MAG: site-specific DNA-methyltransferase [Verrucomicrobia bacterium]|nr:site-specific DNA-methyltransferase [Verrucomicrobiota bacterium]